MTRTGFILKAGSCEKGYLTDRERGRNIEEVSIMMSYFLNLNI